MVVIEAVSFHPAGLFQILEINLAIKLRIKVSEKQSPFVLGLLILNTIFSYDAHQFDSKSIGSGFLPFTISSLG